MPNDGQEIAKSQRNKGQFVAGHKGRGGRPKGSKNKATIRRELAIGKADKILHDVFESRCSMAECATLFHPTCTLWLIIIEYET